MTRGNVDTSASGRWADPASPSPSGSPSTSSRPGARLLCHDGMHGAAVGSRRPYSGGSTFQMPARACNALGTLYGGRVCTSGIPNACRSHARGAVRWPTRALKNPARLVSHRLRVPFRRGVDDAALQREGRCVHPHEIQFRYGGGTSLPMLAARVTTPEANTRGQTESVGMRARSHSPASRKAVAKKVRPSGQEANIERLVPFQFRYGGWARAAWKADTRMVYGRRGTTKFITASHILGDRNGRLERLITASPVGLNTGAPVDCPGISRSPSSAGPLTQLSTHEG